MQTLISKFLRAEEGATAIEYALIASFISLMIITAAANIGTKVGNTFTKVAAPLQ